MKIYVKVLGIIGVILGGLILFKFVHIVAGISFFVVGMGLLVYYGFITTNIKHDITAVDPDSKSQFGQDLLALKYHNYKNNGTYLEIGVHDGENDNNTALMDQKYGWNGLCIDPFMKNMKNRSCQQFNVALGSKPGKELFRDGNSGLSGLDKFATSDKHNAMWEKEVKKFPLIEVAVRTPEDVFQEANLPSVIDYMSLDVEGAEMDILKAIPFDKYCIKYATIETNNDKDKEKELEMFMKQRGYIFEGHSVVDHIFSNKCMN